MINSEQKMEQARRAVLELYCQPAADIVKMVESNPLAIVTGPFANGKSDSLLPLVKDRLEDRNFSVLIRDAQKAEYLIPNYGEALVTDLPEADKGVLIIDEAGEVSARGEGINDVAAILRRAHDRNYKVVSVISYFAENTTVRDKQTETWQAGGESISGIKAPAYHMSPIRLSQELYKALIEAQIGINRVEVSPVYLDYLVQRMPRSLVTVGAASLLLMRTRYDSSLRLLALNTLDHINLWLGAITYQEADDLRNSLMPEAVPGWIKPSDPQDPS